MLRCTGCGSTETIEEIRAKYPQAISCCPERDMQDDGTPSLEARIERLEKIIAHLCPDKSDDV